jgi:pimeloyl-ACP methyl ester carboxylesterase
VKVEASDGAQLYVEVHGESGIPILFSCAYCTTHENWRSQVEPLVAAGARVILWDFRGHGLSDAPPEPERYSIEQVVDDLGRVLDAVSPGEPVVLAGLSFGGLASIHFALAHPERTRALALVDSGPGFKNPDAQAKWTAQVARTAEVLTTRGFDAFVRGKAAITCVGRHLDLPASKAAAASIEKQDPQGLANFGIHISGPAPAVIDELSTIACPALVVVGSEDKPYLRAAEVMAAKIPNAEHQVIEGAAHIVNIEATDAFNAVLIDFLKRL